MKELLDRIKKIAEIENDISHFGKMSPEERGRLGFHISNLILKTGKVPPPDIPWSFIRIKEKIKGKMRESGR